MGDSSSIGTVSIPDSSIEYHFCQWKKRLLHQISPVHRALNFYWFHCLLEQMLGTLLLTFHNGVNSTLNRFHLKVELHTLAVAV